jgi:hypothetical protein
MLPLLPLLDRLLLRVPSPRSAAESLPARALMDLNNVRSVVDRARCSTPCTIVCILEQLSAASAAVAKVARLFAPPAVATTRRSMSRDRAGWASRIIPTLGRSSGRHKSCAVRSNERSTRYPSSAAAAAAAAAAAVSSSSCCGSPPASGCRVPRVPRVEAEKEVEA